MLHGGIERVPFCRVINNKTLPEVTEELPGQGQGVASLSGSLEELQECCWVLPHQQDRDSEGTGGARGSNALDMGNPC